jgi:hypothetical protein
VAAKRKKERKKNARDKNLTPFGLSIVSRYKEASGKGSKLIR